MHKTSFEQAVTSLAFDDLQIMDMDTEVVSRLVYTRMALMAVTTIDVCLFSVFVFNTKPIAAQAIEATVTMRTLIMMMTMT